MAQLDLLSLVALASRKLAMGGEMMTKEEKAEAERAWRERMDAELKAKHDELKAHWHEVRLRDAASLDLASMDADAFSTLLDEKCTDNDEWHPFVDLNHAVEYIEARDQALKAEAKRELLHELHAATNSFALRNPKEIARRAECPPLPFEYVASLDCAVSEMWEKYGAK